MLHHSPVNLGCCPISENASSIRRTDIFSTNGDGFYPNVHRTRPSAYNDAPPAVASSALSASITGVAVAAAAVDDSASRMVTSCIRTTFFLYG